MTDDGFTFVDIFAGIGGTRIPFDELGGNCVFTSEWDPHAQDMYEANFGERPQGDITKIDASKIPDHDILIAGFPCQPFSIIGSKKGFADTRGTLFFDIERILAEKQPSAFLLENVKMLTNHDKGRTFSVIQEKLRSLGYDINWKVLNALDFGLPQKRERVIIVGLQKKTAFEFPQPIKEKISLSEIIEKHETVDNKHFASKYIIKKRKEKTAGRKIPSLSIWHENKRGDIGINEFSCALRAGASYNYLLVDGIRRLTPRENLLLQGFPRSFKIVSNDAQVRKQAGNSVPVPLIREVAKQLLKALTKPELKSKSRLEIQTKLAEVAAIEK